MNQLLNYNIASGIVHQKKRTTISEVIVRVKRNSKQNRDWFYFKFSVESSSFIFNNFKTTENLSFVWFDQSVFLSKFVTFHPQTVKRIVTPLFRCFSLFLPHLTTLAQEIRSEIVFVLGLVGVVFVSIRYCREI